MAGPVLKFRWNTTDLSLLSVTTFMLDAKRGGYLPGVAPEVPGREPAPIVENLPTFSQVSNDNAMATQEQALNAMVRRAARFVADPTEAHPVWLHAQMKGETNDARALVRSIVYSPVISRFDGSTGSAGTRHFEHNIVIERNPYWEAATSTTVAQGTPSVLGGAYALGTVGGDVPARLRLLSIAGVDTFNPATMWAGFRSSTKHGTLANFVSRWECEDGHNATDAADAADATASDGNRVTVSFATQTGWYNRLFLRMDDVTANYSDNYGRFLVLARAKLSGTGACDIRLQQGISAYPSAYDFAALTSGPAVEVADTSWHMYELGAITLPMPSIRVADVGYASTSALGIEARRTSGSVSLYLDCLVLVPIDEFFIKSGNDAAEGGIYTVCDPLLQFSQYRQYAYPGTPDIPATTSVDPPLVSGVGIPPGVGNLYIVAADDGMNNAYDDQATVDLTYYARYRSLRGSA